MFVTIGDSKLAGLQKVGNKDALYVMYGQDEQLAVSDQSQKVESSKVDVTFLLFYFLKLVKRRWTG